uniref:NAD binding rossmann fold n=1 Tax=Mycena chlorophos TaxID=658473 RepID=A0ABQ0LSA3_MYCCL|nr:NAD binding rossmann fold [Mycena chlorophos]
MAPIKTCVLGTGLAGLTFHAPFVLALPEFELVAILERNPQSAGGKLHDRFGVAVRIHNSLEQVVNDPEIELVIVGTPNSTHYGYAKAALEAGKHVLVDKPIAPTASEARELEALAKSKGLILYPFHNRRFDSDFLALKKLLSLPPSSPNYLGDAVEFETHFDRFRRGIKGSWKEDPGPGQGLVYDLGTHLLDQSVALFGRPNRLTAFVANSRGIGHPDVPDSFTVTLHYDAGGKLPRPVTTVARAQLLSVRSPQPRYYVLGTKGSYVKYGVDVQEDQLNGIASPNEIHSERFGVEPESIWGTVECLEEDDLTMKKTIWPSEPGRYADLFRNLAAAIRDGADLAIPWAEAASVIELVELAHKSAKEGATIVVPSTTMTLVDIRVELPAFSRSINVQVPDSATIQDVKEEISRVCVGSPRVDGQRVIWRGRPLVNTERIQELWKSPEEPRIVHLAVHPSAWSSAPPEVPQRPFVAPAVPAPLPSFSIPSVAPAPAAVPPQPTDYRPLAYVSARHEQAISALEQSPVQRLAPETLVMRSAAVDVVENHGWQWPNVLDEEFPFPERGGVKYERTILNGQTYLRLVDSTSQPTAIQLHALKVLSVTFSILAIPTPAAPPPPPITTVMHTLPEVNALLQQLGVPVAVGRNGVNVAPNVLAQQPVPVPAAAPAAPEIPLRPLLVPLFLLMLRTAVLLYFFAPARKPVIGILIIAWMLYEVWRPIREGLIRGWNQAAAERAAQRGQGPPGQAQQQQPQQQPQQQQQGGAPAAPMPNLPDRRRAANELDQQVDAIFDGLANFNIENEQDVFRRNAPEPGLASKIATFVTLFVSTLHPAVWNRRRAVLRQRETQVRVDANARAAELLDTNPEDAEQRARLERQQQLIAQHNERPQWIREYIGRVVEGVYVDEAD